MATQMVRRLQGKQIQKVIERLFGENKTFLYEDEICLPEGIVEELEKAHLCATLGLETEDKVFRQDHPFFRAFWLRG